MFKNGQTYFRKLAVFTPRGFNSMFGHFSTLCMKRITFIHVFTKNYSPEVTSWRHVMIGSLRLCYDFLESQVCQFYFGKMYIILIWSLTPYINMLFYIHLIILLHWSSLLDICHFWNIKVALHLVTWECPYPIIGAT